MSPIPLGILAASGAAGGSYELIESNILTSTASSVTFSSIPSDYKHLQIRAVTQDSATTSSQHMFLQFNSDAGTSYSYHLLNGYGPAVQSYGIANKTEIQLWDATPGDTTPQIFGAAIIDILDYANTNKNTTTRALHGALNTNEQDISLASGLWMNTAAVSSITLINNYQYFNAGSRFSLYGIRG